jgi:phosphoribosylformylglycinamidine synthase
MSSSQTVSIDFKQSLARAKKREPLSLEDAKKNLQRHKISASEFDLLQNALGRLPTMSELGIFSAMWSEHCSYKSSKALLRRLPTTGEHVVQGPGENAGVIRLEDTLCVAFKMESHNHPSFIEPYQGAATGVGGILRDVFCMGARPIANLNCLRFGSRKIQRTDYLVSNVVRGIGDYGNCFGVPTVGGNVSFDSSYDGNCLVNAMAVGVIDEHKVFRGFASGTGNLVVYVGSATGRDGIHGATMASDSFAAVETGERSTIQVGDPFMEKLLLEATLEVLEKGLVVGLQDMGAAGLTSSSFEMAGRAGQGLIMDLDLVPMRAARMTAYELLLSESQERMLMVIEPKNWNALKQVLDKWLLESAVIGVVTDSGRVQILREGVLEADVPVGAVTDNAPVYDRPRKKRDLAPLVAQKSPECSVQTGLEAVLKHQGAVTSIVERYDRSIGNRTVLESTQGGGAVLWLGNLNAKAPSHLGVGISTACDERLVAIDPQRGTALSMLKAARMLVAAGATPLAVTDCLNFGNPEDPLVMNDIADSIEGLREAALELKTPVVSGNVSLYNETDKKSIKPTPMIGMVGKIADVRQTRKPQPTGAAEIFLIVPKYAQLSWQGSFLNQLFGVVEPYAPLPDINWTEERATLEFVQTLPSTIAVRELGKGGVLTAVAKSTLPAGLGFAIEDETLAKSGLLGALGEYRTGFVAFAASDVARSLASKNSVVVCRKIGSVVGQRVARFGAENLDYERLKANWLG